MTLDEQIKSVGREIGLRRAVYPKFVASKRLTQEKADHELAAMEEVYKTLKQLRDGHRAPPSFFCEKSKPCAEQCLDCARVSGAAAAEVPKLDPAVAWPFPKGPRP